MNKKSSTVERLTADYVQKCASKGIRKYPDIYSNLKNEINELNKELSKVEPLREELFTLNKISDNISKIIQSHNTEIEFKDESQEMSEIREKVISIVDKQSPISNSEISLIFREQEPNSYGFDGKIIRAIKYLSMQGILDKKDRLIVKGPNWAE